MPIVEKKFWLEKKFSDCAPKGAANKKMKKIITGDMTKIHASTSYPNYS